VLPPPTLDDSASPSAPNAVRTALAKAGTLLVDLADQALRLGVFMADHDSARTLAGSLCRRAEVARQIGRRLALRPMPPHDADECDATTLVNDAILALDGVAFDVEYASELASERKIKNQIARARLAVMTAGGAIDEVRRVVAAQA
jgi:hypothetical protein